MTNGNGADGGDKEYRKAFEETQRKNMAAMLLAFKQQKKDFDAAMERFQFAMNEFQSVKAEFEQTKKQVAYLLQVAYQGGSTPEDQDGNHD